MHLKTVLCTSLLGCLFAIGCSQSPPLEPAHPDWVMALIKRFESEPVGNPPQSILKYLFNGQTVYFVPAQCCDQYSTLYDSLGRTMGAPDGGLTGTGDGRCPDFFKNRTDEVLIWRDSRTR